MRLWYQILQIWLQLLGPYDESREEQVDPDTHLI